MVESNTQHRNTGVRYGLLAGLASIAVYYGLYSQDVALLFSRLGGIVGGIILVGMIASAWSLNKTNQKRVPNLMLGFRQFVRPTFTVGLLGLLLVIEFNYVMYNFVDKSLGEQHKNWSIDLFEKQLALQTANSQAATTLEQTLMMARDAEPKYTIGNAFQQLIFFLVPVFMLSAVVSFVFLLLSNRRLVTRQQSTPQRTNEERPLDKK